MDKLRILNLFAIAFLVSLLVQYWFFPKPSTTPILPDITISVEKDSIVVPNIPKVTIHNTTTGAIMINPCSDIKISADGVELTGIAEFSKNLFCLPLSISGGSMQQLSFNSLYPLFATKPGKYIVILNTRL